MFSKFLLDDFEHVTGIKQIQFNVIWQWYTLSSSTQKYELFSMVHIVDEITHVQHIEGFFYTRYIDVSALGVMTTLH